MENNKIKRITEYFFIDQETALSYFEDTMGLSRNKFLQNPKKKSNGFCHYDVVNYGRNKRKMRKIWLEEIDAKEEGYSYKITIIEDPFIEYEPEDKS